MTLENPVLARGALPAVTRVAMIVALVLALLTTVIAAATGVASLIGEVLSGRTTAVLSSGAPLPTSVVHGRLVEGAWRQADVVLRDVPGGIVALGAISDGAGTLARLALGVVLMVLLLAVLRRTPFTNTTALQVAVGGAAVAVGALLEVGLGVLRDWMLADLLTGGGSGSWPASSIFDPTLLVVGFGAMVVGLLLSHGSQLQREADGLV